MRYKLFYTAYFYYLKAPVSSKLSTFTPGLLSLTLPLVRLANKSALNNELAKLATKKDKKRNFFTNSLCDKIF